MKIKVGISNKHAHLTQEQIEELFGCGYKLTFLRNFGQPDEYVSNEKIDIIGPKGRINNVRIVGPARDKAQIEITLTNAREIGVDAKLRVSKDVEGSSGIILCGPKGEYRLNEGVIAAIRHLHMNPTEAKMLGIVENQRVCIETEGDRALIFKNVVVRINEMFSLEFHIDTDEANAAGIKNGDDVRLIL